MALYGTNNSVNFRNYFRIGTGSNNGGNGWGHNIGGGNPNLLPGVLQQIQSALVNNGGGNNNNGNGNNNVQNFVQQNFQNNTNTTMSNVGEGKITREQE